MAFKTSLALKHYLKAHTKLNFKVTQLGRDSRKETLANKDIDVCVFAPNGYVFTSTFLHAVITIDSSFEKSMKDECTKLPLKGIWNKLIFETGFDVNDLIVQNVNTNVSNEKSINPKPKTLSNYEKIVALVTEKGNDRNDYTAEELALVATYEGKGGLHKEGVRGTGILSEFYTPDSICQKMWGLAYKHGYNGGKVLEPSCGIGRFLKYANPTLVDAYEIDKVACAICMLLYPEANIKFASFETKFFRGSFHTPKVDPIYSLVIGNPPYESYQSQYSSKEKQATGAFTFDQYFITRGLDLLLPGGVMVFIVPSSFMRNERKYNQLKEEIEAKATLVEAYRLPNESFHNTYVGTDILVFKKKYY